jgi:hypothetical protein
MGLKSTKDYDRQAAEDHNSLDCVCLAWLIKARFFFGWLFDLQKVHFTSAAPMGVGSAKKGESHVS